MAKREKTTDEKIKLTQGELNRNKAIFCCVSSFSICFNALHGHVVQLKPVECVMDNDNMELTVVQLNGCVLFCSISGSVIIIGYFMKFTVAAPRPNIFSAHFDSGISSRQFQILVTISL